MRHSLAYDTTVLELASACQGPRIWEIIHYENQGQASKSIFIQRLLYQGDGWIRDPNCVSSGDGGGGGTEQNNNLSRQKTTDEEG